MIKWIYEPIFSSVWTDLFEIRIFKNIEVSSYLVILAEHVNDLLVCVCASVGSILHSLWRVKFEIQTNDH